MAQCLRTLLAALCVAHAAAVLHHALAEDLYAFPKYRVVFLNTLPVHNHTAERWLDAGLRGGELEFLGQPWESQPSDRRPKEIDGGGTAEQQVPEQQTVASNRLQRMTLSPNQAFVCLIPPPSDDTAATSEEEVEADITPAQGLGLLRHLSGSCLYHRDGWFTYSYCHNQQVRQFREMAHTHPHPPGYRPEEDPSWESFTLGQAPAQPEDGTELTVAEQDALSSSVEVAHAPTHRYIVEKWSDGTICDKTGQPREIEVQFHCDLTTTDTIVSIRERRTCAYVMVVHTPRLCGEPGFKTRLEQRKETYIRCREIVDDLASLDRPDYGPAESSHPWRERVRVPTLGVAAPQKPLDAGTEEDIGTGRTESVTEVLRKAIEKAVQGAFSGVMDGDVNVVGGDNMEGEDVYIQVLDLDGEFAGEVGDWLHDGNRLEEILRAAGYGIRKVDDNEEEEQTERRRQKSIHT